MTARALTPLLGLLLLGGCQTMSSAPSDAAPQVGAITQDMDGGFGSGWLLARKTTFLQAEAPASSVAVDPDRALAHYDALLTVATDSSLRAEAMRRAAYLRVRRFDTTEAADPALLEKAVSLYAQLLAEQPDAPGNDLALYQMARAQDLQGRRGDAADTLARLTEHFPNSSLYADTAFRAAELFYGEARYAAAARSYERLLEPGADAGELESIAQYKAGWSRLQAGDTEQAARVFLRLLEAHLPPSDDADATEARLAEVPARDRELITDALRGLSFSFLRSGGTAALARHLQAAEATAANAPIYYTALAERLLARERFTEAAESHAAFSARYPHHPLAADASGRAIAVYEAGGFDALAIDARTAFAQRYAPEAAYWDGREHDAAFMVRYREHLATLAQHHHAAGQGEALSDSAARDAYRQAADWYERWLALSPDDPEAGRMRMRLADALLDGGAVERAVPQYAEVAYGPEPHDASREAALAAVQAQLRLAKAAHGGAVAPAMRRMIALSRKLADRYPEHPEKGAVLVRAAEEAYRLEDYEEARAIAATVHEDATVPAMLRREGLHILADSHFATGAYPQAEAAYGALLAGSEPGDARRAALREQLASTIYRQGEAARAADEPLVAAAFFARVADAAPDSPLRANADFDAAVMYAKAERWAEAAQAFATLRRRHPEHALLPDADKWLARAYVENRQPGLAATVHARIAGRETESPALRQEAAWQAAVLHESAGSADKAMAAYRSYVARYEQPLDRAQQARSRLGRPAVTGAQEVLAWQRRIVTAHEQAGASAGDYSALLAARAHLYLGQDAAERARQTGLRHPLRESLPRRRDVAQEAIRHLKRAEASEFEEVVTAATYRRAAIYADIAAALRSSERPAGLSPVQADEYDLLVEDEAYPIEEQAIAIHEGNLQRLLRGVWDDWVHRSAEALAMLVPGRYEKREQREAQYEAMF